MSRSLLTRRTALRAAGGGAFYLGHLGLGALLNAVEGCGGTTGGRIVTIDTQVRMADSDRHSFINRHGWEVSLTEAKLARGRLEFYAAEEPVASGVSPSSWLSEAHAHPGHEDEGSFLGEVLGSDVVNLLDVPHPQRRGSLVSGTVSSARLSFEPTEMDGTAVRVEGVARRSTAMGEDLRPFIAVAFAGDMLSQHDAPEVWGCPFEGDTAVFDDGMVTLTVWPSLWFDDVRFELHEVSTAVDDERIAMPFDPLLEPHAAFIAGVRGHDSYVFSYAPF